ncbi:MAG: S8 family serine peptidase [Planctomycetes bacterium]|nr:S8 family serine peptidase [Planctomycetota bacterium]MBI3836035.1 S8 family serine peptidase [Planctomycetota bacterium]
MRPQPTWTFCLCVVTAGTTLAALPNDPDFPVQWYLNNTGQSVNGISGMSGADIDALSAWAVYPGTNNVTVAIVDTGVNPHTEFAGRLLDGYVTSLAGGDPYSTLDTGPHGTYVAGIVGASSNNSEGIAGVHGSVSLLPVRALSGSTGTEQSAAEGILWAVDHGASVILVALQFYDGTDELRDAVTYAATHDVVVVAPTGHLGQNTVAYPAAFDGCIAVASTTSQDNVTAFSNYGPEVDLSAPSEDIWSTWIDDGYSFGPHPSGAAGAALVAGVAVLIRSYAPQLSATQIAQLLRDSANDLGDPGWDEHFGAGRLNAAKAMTIAAKPAFRFEHVAAIPTLLTPGQTNTFNVRIANVAQTVVASTARVLYRTQAGSFTQSTSLRSIGNSLYAIDLPPFSCGDGVDFYLTASGSGSTTVNDPPNAPAAFYHATAIAYNKLFEDDFEVDLGWSSINAGSADTHGLWTRVIPVGTSAQPDYDHTPNGGEYCYITGQHISGNDGTDDVDNGPVRLVSPVIGITSDNVEVSYAAWFQTSSGTPDVLTVEASRNGGTTWQLAETIPGTDGWEMHQFNLSGLHTITGNQLRVRFTTSDVPNDSLTEAGIDDFRVRAILCEATLGDTNHDGHVNLLDYSGLRPCLLGPSGTVNAGCALFDFTIDSHVDLKDWQRFQNAFTG